jgi:glutathionyl-hydroquinone reductase
MHEALARLDRRLAGSRYLLGDRLTLADVRLWVTLVRFGAPTDGTRRIGAQFARYRTLWAYAQNLYEQEAFQRTTDPAAFSAGADLSGPSGAVQQYVSASVR